MSPFDGHVAISTILKHDTKVTSYKLALLRALNDLALSFPDVGRNGEDVAVPLRRIAQRWVAYRWPFVALAAPVPLCLPTSIFQMPSYKLPVASFNG